MSNQDQRKYFWSHVIPPYLLNLCYGEHLRNAVVRNDPCLASSNSVRALVSVPRNHKCSQIFTKDSYLEFIVKEKLVSRLSDMGVLGIFSLESLWDNDTLIFHYFKMFQDKLVDGSESELLDRILPDDFGKHLLRELLFKLQGDTYAGSLIPPGLEAALENNPFAVSNYSLPIFWTPLFLKRVFDANSPHVTLSIANICGYLCIHLESKSVRPGSLPVSATKTPIYNFVGDKAVNCRTGVFYYEVEIEQVCSASTLNMPLIKLSDMNTHLDPSICVALGFCCNSVKLELHLTDSRESLESGPIVSLDSFSRNLLRFSHETPDLVSKVLSLTQDMPGTFEGSYALNLSNSMFMSSIKSAEHSTRSGMASLNRRLNSLGRLHLGLLDPGRMDIGAQCEQSISAIQGKTVHTTSCIGVGINFFEKSIFFTMNGIMIKSIPNSELIAKDLSMQLFDSKYPNSHGSLVLPVMGFKMNAIQMQRDVNFLDKKSVTPSTTTIKTNLGHRDFLFDIGHYVEGLKNKHLKTSKLSKADGSQTLQEFKNKLSKKGLNLDEAIYTYLNRRGYFDALGAFQQSKLYLPLLNIKDTACEKKNRESIANRTLLSELMFLLDFDGAIAHLQAHYLALMETSDIKFRIRFIEFKYWLYRHCNSIASDRPDSSPDFQKKARRCFCELSKNTVQMTCYNLQTLAPLVFVESPRDLKQYTKALSMLSKISLQITELFQSINEQILDFEFPKASQSQKLSNGTSCLPTLDLDDVLKSTLANIYQLAIDSGQCTDYSLINFENDYLS